MKTLLPFLLVAGFLFMAGCAHTPSEPVSVPDTSKRDLTTSDNFTVEYAPQGWEREKTDFYQIFYSPEVAKEAGEQSLSLRTVTEVETLEEYIKKEGECVVEKQDLTIGSHPAMQFKFAPDCTDENIHVIVMDMGEVLIQGYSYSLEAEREQIIKILESLVLEE